MHPLLGSALELWQRRNYDAALVAIEEALVELSPGDIEGIASGCTLKANCLFDLEEYDVAIEAFAVSEGYWRQLIAQGGGGATRVLAAMLICRLGWNRFVANIRFRVILQNL